MNWNTLLQIILMYLDKLPARFVAELHQPAFNGPHGAMQVHTQAPPTHFVADYNYFQPPSSFPIVSSNTVTLEYFLLP
ncbi:hypothetical protein ACOSP7_017676 [Xanthoceras sorbifolium]